MENNALPYLLGILICSLPWAVAFALASWRAVFRSTRNRKSPDALQTPISDAHYASIRVEMAELYSTLEKLTTTVKRLSSRQGMQSLREREAAAESLEPPPAGTSKAELRKHYGLNGLTSAQIALKAQQVGRE